MPHLAVWTLFDYGRWSCQVTQSLFSVPSVDESSGCKSVDVRRVWENYDDLLQFMTRSDALLLDESLRTNDVYLVRGLSGLGLLRLRLLTPIGLLVAPFWRGALLLGVAPLGLGWSGLVGPRSVRIVAMLLMPMMLVMFFMYRDSSIAPLLEMRRRFKAVMDVLDYIFRNGTSLSRSVELTVQWDRILAAGPVYLVTLEDFRAVQDQGLGHFLRTVSDVHHRLSDFIHGVVVHRRDEAFRGWRIGCGRIPLFTRISGL